MAGCVNNTEIWRSTKIKEVIQLRCAIEPRFILFDEPKKTFRLHGVKFRNQEDTNCTRDNVVYYLRKLLVEEESSYNTKHVQICEVPRTGSPLAIQVRTKLEGEWRDVSTLMIHEGFLEKDDGTTHSKSGGTQSSPGIIYPRLWCMWICLILMEQGIKFSLRPEYERAGKFEDIFLQCKDELADQWIELYIQIKHKESQRIELECFEKLNKNKLFIFDEVAQSIRLLGLDKDRTKYYFMWLSNTNFEFKKNDIQRKVISVPCCENIFSPGNLFQIRDISPKISEFEDQIVFALNQYSINDLKSMIELKLLASTDGNSVLMKVKYSRLQILVQEAIETMHVPYIDNEKLEKLISECDQIGQIHHKLQEPCSNVERYIEEQQKVYKTLLAQKESSEIIDVLISSDEGFGRSEFVRRIVQNCKDEFDHIIWLDGSNPVPDIRELSKKLMVYDDENPEKTIDQTFIQLNKYRTLLIYEDATKDTPMPNGNYNNIYVVVTSELNDIGSKIIILLKEATLDDCKECVETIIQTVTVADAYNIADSFLKTAQGVQSFVNLVPTEHMEMVADLSKTMFGYIPSSAAEECFNYTISNVIDTLKCEEQFDNTKTLAQEFSDKVQDRIQNIQLSDRGEEIQEKIECGKKVFEGLFDKYL